jgi:uncharacterized protein (DUF924 family)
MRPIERVWVYMPFMHSEALLDQEDCVRKFTELADECGKLEGGEELEKMLRGFAKYGAAHRDVVKQWGRFPHRNAILGRTSTEEEVQGIADGSIPKW